MNEPIDLATCSEAELWRYVASHLASRGICVVLVGRAVVSIHSDEAYRSGDLDFVQEQLFGERVEDAMERMV